MKVVVPPPTQDLRFERAVTSADIVAFQALKSGVPVADEVIVTRWTARTSHPPGPIRPSS